MEKEEYPIRINKYLAMKKVSTRRGADDLIERGLIKINGKRAKLGDKVNEGDKVDVSDKAIKERNFKYVAFYKPRGIVTHSPQSNEKSIADVIDLGDLFPIGRLDKESEGLIILTNDGRITDRLLNPEFEHEKEYRVVVREKVPSRVVKVLEAGVMENDERLTAKKVSILGNGHLSITLTQGKRHQIRRMLSFMRLTVEKLKRVRIMNVKLTGLLSGETRVLEGKEKEKFLKGLDLL